MTRDHVLVNHSWFSPPILKALDARGLAVSQDSWERLPVPPHRMLAAFIWFYDALRYPVKVFRFRRLMRRHGVPIVAWNQDAPHYLNRAKWRLDLLSGFHLLDIYATHTLVDKKRQFADTVLYFPNAADTDRYALPADDHPALTRLRDSQSYRYDVSFFGAMDGQRYKEMRGRADFFSALGVELERRNIRFLFREAKGMGVDEQVELIQSSRINLNFGASCDFNFPIASGLPERCYGIPACGGFLLCDKRTHAQDDFTPGVNWAEFDGLDDCVAKIEYWLAHFDAARDLAERCYHHVMAHHTYAHRAQKLHEALLAWHAGERGLLR